ncbi:MAG: hypothetical protein PHU64_00075 [Candidatus Omnitrophica bacterium]|nr:hypothetical protein [Candidatus Omnitrophota bacterium]MDD5430280.1 hypothetical protein [Candidatus Omnitrophota bacterium]
MRRKVKAILVIFLLGFLVCGAGFSQYVELDGKRIIINGPSKFKNLGVAPDKDVCDALIVAAEYGDKELFEGILNSFDVIRIKNNSSAVVIEEDLFGYKAKVLLVSGLHRGLSGWIPIDWLKNNQNQPSIPEYDG